jgi:hypothetical protein
MMQVGSRVLIKKSSVGAFNFQEGSTIEVTEGNFTALQSQLRRGNVELIEGNDATPDLHADDAKVQPPTKRRRRKNLLAE